MRRSSLLSLLTCVVIFGALAAWVKADSPASNKTVRANEAAVRRVYEHWAKGFHNHDIAAIMSLYGPEDAIVAYDFVPPLQIRGKAAYRKNYEEFLEQYVGPVDIEFRDMRVVAGEDVAFLHTLQRITAKSKNGNKVDMWGRCTSGLRKINDRWLIVHDHCSVPSDFENGKALMDLKP